MTRAIFLLCAALGLLSKAVADTHCYYPDGTIDDVGTAPCNATAAVSACCDPRDSCSVSGLCLGASGWIYRSSCTDKTWTSSACAAQCHTDPLNKKPYNTFAPIVPCSSGVTTGSFCCASPNGNCCSNSFQLPNTGLAFKPGTDLIQAQLANASSAAASSAATVTATVTATASATAAASSSSNSNLGTAIGAGVGVPLGVLAVALIAFLVWRERRKRSDPAMMGGAAGSSVGWSQAGSPPQMWQHPVQQQGPPMMGQQPQHQHQQQYGGPPMHEATLSPPGAAASPYMKPVEPEQQQQQLHELRA